MITAKGSVIVTGAARGIGLAVVDRLLDSGYRVLALDIFETEELPYMSSTRDQLLKRQEHFGQKQIKICKCDVREYDELRDIVESFLKVKAGTSGGTELCAVIACAGVVDGTQRSWHLDRDVERLIVETNLFGVMNLARSCLDHLISSNSPVKRFVAVSSIAGAKALPRLGAYVASKHGVNGYVKSLALELKNSGITANVVAPGSTKGEILNHSARIYDLDSADSFASQHLTNRLIEPTEVADAIMFLLSERANSITGSVLNIDAGLSLA